MAKRIEVTSKQEAWEIVNQIFPSDYSEDTGSSERAGYPVYRSSVEFYDYICDLGDRLEVNLKNGCKTINVWIVEPEEKKPVHRGCVKVTEYRSCKWAKNGMRPEELKKLAQQIFSNGTITKTYHQAYGTNDPAVTHGDEWATVLNGGVAYTVECEGLPVKYVIHMTGFEVSEIIEEIFR